MRSLRTFVIGTAIGLSLLLIGTAARAQQNYSPYIGPNGVVFPLSDPTSVVNSASLTRLGFGQRSISYWIVSNNLLGQSAAAGPFTLTQAANHFGSGNGAIITWNTIPGVDSYDILRTENAEPPTGACNCAVATGVVYPLVTDSSESLSAYTVNPVNPSALAITLRNVFTGPDESCLAEIQGGTEQCIGSGGGGTPGEPQYAVQFNNPDGSFAGNAGFTYNPEAGTEEPELRFSPNANDAPASFTTNGWPYFITSFSSDGQNWLIDGADSALFVSANETDNVNSGTNLQGANVQAFLSGTGLTGDTVNALEVAALAYSYSGNNPANVYAIHTQMYGSSTPTGNAAALYIEDPTAAFPAAYAALIDGGPVSIGLANSDGSLQVYDTGTSAPVTAVTIEATQNDNSNAATTTLGLEVETYAGSGTGTANDQYVGISDTVSGNSSAYQPPSEVTGMVIGTAGVPSGNAIGLDVQNAAQSSAGNAYGIAIESEYMVHGPSGVGAALWIGDATYGGELPDGYAVLTEGGRQGFTGPVQGFPVAFAALEACTSLDEGTRYSVTDANAVLPGAIITAGGGSNHVPAYCNGTAWIVD